MRDDPQRFDSELDFALASFVVNDLGIRSRDVIDRLKSRILSVRDGEMDRLRQQLAEKTAEAEGWKKATDQAGLAIMEISRERGEAQDRANAAEGHLAVARNLCARSPRCAPEATPNPRSG